MKINQNQVQNALHIPALNRGRRSDQIIHWPHYTIVMARVRDQGTNRYFHLFNFLQSPPIRGFQKSKSFRSVVCLASAAWFWKSKFISQSIELVTDWTVIATVGTLVTVRAPDIKSFLRVCSKNWTSAPLKNRYLIVLNYSCYIGGFGSVDYAILYISAYIHSM